MIRTDVGVDLELTAEGIAVGIIALPRNPVTVAIPVIRLPGNDKTAVIQLRHRWLILIMVGLRVDLELFANNPAHGVIALPEDFRAPRFDLTIRLPRHHITAVAKRRHRRTLLIA